MTGVLVHEWIAQAGGSENVLQAMSEVYPHADIYCLWNDSTGRFDPGRIRETWLARSPLRKSKAAALPLMPLTWRMLKADRYEWALISSHAFAHHVTFGDPHLRRHVYVHTPARYVWTPELDRRGAGAAARLAASCLKGVDRRRANEGAHFAANSEFVRRRIREAWNVDARVIHPPVDVELIQSRNWSDLLEDSEKEILDALPDAFVLGASRFIPYKRLDLVIRTGEVADAPVVLAGNGPELARLRELGSAAKVDVRIVLSPSDALLRALYARALVYVFPAVEDFGIMPVEAMASGVPVIGQAVGGVAESIEPGVTGALTTFESDADISEAFDLAVEVDRVRASRRAHRFSRARFAEEISGWVTP